MPILVLETNVKVSNPKEFVLSLSKLCAELLKKPEKYISICYRYNEYLSFSGTFDPAFQLTVVSLDNINPESTEVYSKDLSRSWTKRWEFRGTEATCEKLGYGVTHVVLKTYLRVFNDPGRAYIGHEGTTVAQLFSK